MGRYKVDPITGELTLMNPSMSDIPIYQGVSGSTASVSGLVPQAQAGDEEKALLGNGTWGTVAGGGQTISYADWLQLTPEEQTHGEYFIPDYSGSILPVGGFDNVPTSGSLNPVTSNGIYESISTTNEMIANIEPSTTSTHAYTIGQQFILNGVLHIATAAISVGDTLAVGTNCAINQSITEQIKTIVGKMIPFSDGQNPAFSNGATSTQRWNIDCTGLNELNEEYGHRDVLVMGNDYVGLWDSTDSNYQWKLNNPVTIEQGGTGGTTPAKAKENLGLGTEGQNVVFANPTTSNQRGQLVYTVQNANNTGYSHRDILVFTNAGIFLWDDYLSQILWSIRNNAPTTMLASDIQSNRIVINSGGYISYIIRNGICYLTLSNVKFGGDVSTATDPIILNNLPQNAGQTVHQHSAMGTGTIYAIDFWISASGTQLRVGKNAYTGTFYESFSYPVS